MNSRWFFVLILVVALFLGALYVDRVGAAPETCPIVDGEIDDWDEVPVFAKYWLAGKPDKPNAEVVGELRKMTCSGTVYLLTTAYDGNVVDRNYCGENWAKVDGSKMVDECGDGIDGSQFMFLSGNDGVDGWEASYPQTSIGVLTAHFSFNNGETGAIVGTPTAVDLVRIDARQVGFFEYLWSLVSDRFSGS